MNKGGEQQEWLGTVEIIRGRQERGAGKGMEFWLVPIATNPYATAWYFLGLTNKGTILKPI